MGTLASHGSLTNIPVLKIKYTADSESDNRLNAIEDNTSFRNMFSTSCHGIVHNIFVGLLEARIRTTTWQTPNWRNWHGSGLSEWQRLWSSKMEKKELAIMEIEIKYMQWILGIMTVFTCFAKAPLKNVRAFPVSFLLRILFVWWICEKCY
jgi:hypothetical protein